MSLITENQSETLKLLATTKYKLSQDNGQRIYGPPPDWVGPPPRKTEVFIGSLPRDVYEYDIVPYFEQVGKIYLLRTMLSFSGFNRGYAFIKFCRPEEAERAIVQLNNSEIRPGQRIGVVRSLDNCRLYVGNLPTDKSKEEIFGEMAKLSEGVTDVYIQADRSQGTLNRGFAFVEYATHKAAAKARRKLLPANFTLWGQTLTVDWATPEPEVGDSSLPSVTNLYCRNLNTNLDEHRLNQFFSFNGRLMLVKVKKMKNYAFLNYQTREDAQKALNYLKNMDTKEFSLENCSLDVTWAKPPALNSHKSTTLLRNEYHRGGLSSLSVSNNLMSNSNRRVHFDPNPPSTCQFSMMTDSFAAQQTWQPPHHQQTWPLMSLPDLKTNYGFDHQLMTLFQQLNCNT